MAFCLKDSVLDKPFEEKLSKKSNNKKLVSQDQKEEENPINNKPILYDINYIVEEIRKTPDIRKEKIEKLKAKIKKGEYKVDIEEVAKSILSKQKDLF